jgi:phenylacetate-CoA ligase
MEPIYIEKWMHGRMRRLAEIDPKFRHFMDGSDLAQISRADIDRYHLYKLKRMLAYVHENSAYYRRLFNETGMHADQIDSLSDFSKVPFTNPSDFAENPYHFVCVSLGDVERVTTFTTSGTTGPEKRIFFTKEDLECMTDFMAVGIRAVADENDVIQIMLPSGIINDQTDLLAQGIRKMGARPVASGIMPDAEKQLSTMRKENTSVLFGVVNPVYRVTQQGRLTNDLRQMGIKALFLTSEYLSESMRKQLQEKWDCRVHIHYGLTEMGLGVAVECEARSGFHYNEADLYLEIVNPETGELVEDGEEGELVFTALSFKGTPLIRYRTHDIARFSTQACECGAVTLRKFSNVARRLEAMVEVGDRVKLYPSYFDELLFADPNVIDFQVVVGKEGMQESILVKIEAIQSDEQAAEAIRQRMLADRLIAEIVQGEQAAKLEIEFVSPGELLNLSRAKRLIIDER